MLSLISKPLLKDWGEQAGGYEYVFVCEFMQEREIEWERERERKRERDDFQIELLRQKRILTTQKDGSKIEELFLPSAL